MIWRSIKDDPPTHDRCVVIFPCVTDVGHVYQTSNPEYVRQNAWNQGYRFWADIDPAPGEAEAIAYNNTL